MIEKAGQQVEDQMRQKKEQRRTAAEVQPQTVDYVVWLGWMDITLNLQDRWMCSQRVIPVAGIQYIIGKE